MADSATSDMRELQNIVVVLSDSMESAGIQDIDARCAKITAIDLVLRNRYGWVTYPGG